MRAVVMDPHVSPQDFSGHWLACSSDSKSNNINVFVHLCIAVFVYLCICVFVYLCICVILALSLKVRVKISIDWDIWFSWFAYYVFVYFCICVLVYLCPMARRLGLPEAGGLAGRLSHHSPHSSCLTGKPALARQCKQIQMLFANKYKYSISKYKYLFRI